jgi:hypothetical protein
VALSISGDRISGWSAFAQTIDRIRHDHIVRIAYRADAPPFSYNGSNKERPASCPIFAGPW